MCRLFGSYSALYQNISKPLLTEENSLYVQSKEHRDGWGLAFFHDGIPHTFRSRRCARDDEDFRHLVNTVLATTVIAHLRRATQGEISLLNCHPFQFGKWVFAHNGDLPDFASTKNEFNKSISSRILAHIHGTTDSEIYFALFLSELLKKGLLDSNEISLADCAQALRRAVYRIEEISCAIAPNKPYALNVIVSNGQNFLAYRQGRTLHYRLATEQVSVAIDNDGRQIISELVVCSEPFCSSEDFFTMHDGQMIGVDREHRFHEKLT